MSQLSGILVKNGNTNGDYIWFRTDYSGASYILAPMGGYVILESFGIQYKGADIGSSRSAAGADLYPGSPSQDRKGFSGVMITNVGAKTLLFTPDSAPSDSTVTIPPNKTETLQMGKYTVISK